MEIEVVLDSRLKSEVPKLSKTYEIAPFYEKPEVVICHEKVTKISENGRLKAPKLFYKHERIHEYPFKV